MVFNSIEFALFLPIIFGLYWFVTNKNLTLQNALLLVSSYFFYAFWDYRFLTLLVFSTGLDYFSALKIAQTNNLRHRIFWFWLSVSMNIGFLGVFKYYNFFAESLAQALAQLGLQSHFTTLAIFVPIGISFYTFHGLSYLIDVYQRRIEPEGSFIDYAVFVSFFPLLVAGPIERATHLLPQIKRHRTFDIDKAADGLRQMLWGLFKKMAIADPCGVYTDSIFDATTPQTGSTLALGAVLFSIQIYCDFSGYSDIALGTARLFGIELLRNFAFPYFSRDIAEFWRRWHISLSTWFRDYLYIPLGGSKGNTALRVRNTFVIFLVSGFWHGANWTFIVWGGLHALYFLPLLLLQKNRTHLDIVAAGRWWPRLREVWQMLTTFLMVALAWIFFRAKSIGFATDYVLGIFDRSFFTVPTLIPKVTFLLLVGFCFFVEWLGREQPYALANAQQKWPRGLRWFFYYVLVIAIVQFASRKQNFIYFQF